MYALAFQHTAIKVCFVKHCVKTVFFSSIEITAHCVDFTFNSPLCGNFTCFFLQYTWTKESNNALDKTTGTTKVKVSAGRPF